MCWADRGDAVCPHLCRRHHSIASPAEVWELPPVEAEANRPGVGRDSVLHLELELVEGGKVEVWSWPGKAEDGQLHRRMLGESNVFSSLTSHSLHRRPTTLSRHRHCPDVPSQDVSTAPPTSHWQSRTVETFGRQHQ